MKIIKNILDLNKAIKDYRNIGFVPTMGGIHEGHISLIKYSKKLCKKTIVSIFVNPTQFNNKNDFSNYPRNFKHDIKILKQIKIDYLFIPNKEEIYKKKIKKFYLKQNDKIMCARFRNGHFEGVLNVMNRLMIYIKAKKIFMGEKDFQQLFLIKKYLRKKHSVEIINCPIIRDKNKLALSTRNNLLSNKNYKKASLIAKNLLNFKSKILINKKNIDYFLKKKKSELEKTYKIKIDYLEIRNENGLTKSYLSKKRRLFIAYNIQNIRLIDNF